MIKNLVVNLSVSANQGHAAEDFAISMAGALGAHLTGIAFIYDTHVPVTYPQLGYGEAPAELIDALKREQTDLAKQASDRFTKATSLAGVSADARTLRTSFAGSVDRFGQIARRFDLAVVGQVEPGTNAYEKNIVEGALFSSGRPMIIVPYVHEAPFRVDRVMVCWDGGVAAARAVGDAMPLLARAGRIELVTVAGERGKQVEVDDADIAQHLARHGLTADAGRLAKDHADVADTLLSHAVDSGVDFIVMGGHGHSRVREFFLGSVTDVVLRAVKVPVLMAH
jgi:nucleotide-binding universal stress UspA family protein